MKKCCFCQAQVSAEMVIGYATVCPSCGRPLKVCLNCRYYDPNAYHECLEDIEEAVFDKDLANFCDFFVMKETSENDHASTKEKARSRFLSLFTDE